MQPIRQIINFIDNEFNLNNENILGDEYFYSCLPLCLLDSVFSIGSHYTSTENVINRYSEYYKIEKIRPDKGRLPSLAGQHTLSEFITNIEENGATNFAALIIKNKQLTSSRNGILKADAVLQCADILRKHGIETLQDFNEKLTADIEKEFKKVRGQRSGISLSYLKMLCGDSDLIKPDRHILRFLSNFYENEVKADQAQSIVYQVLESLKNKYSHITIRDLDYIIWSYMKSIKKCA